MYKNKTANGLNNICGEKIKAIRESMKPFVSQRQLSDLMQNHGLDIDKNAIQRIECGKRFVTDIELKAFATVLNVSFSDLLN